MILPAVAIILSFCLMKAMSSLNTSIPLLVNMRIDSDGHLKFNCFCTALCNPAKDAVCMPRLISANVAMSPFLKARIY